MSNWKKLEQSVEHLEDVASSLSLSGGIVVDVAKINSVATASNSGVLSGGTQRVCIATNDVNMSAINTNINTINTSIGNMETDLDALATTVAGGFSTVNVAAINGSAAVDNSGVVGVGVQRMCIATDDINSAAINTATANISTKTDLIEADTDAINSNLVFITNCVNSTNALKTNLYQINDVAISASSGNVGTGVQRVCIASDDVNIAAMKTKIDDIYTILNDVYNAGAGTLNVTVVP